MNMLSWCKIFIGCFLRKAVLGCVPGIPTKTVQYVISLNINNCLIMFNVHTSSATDLKLYM